MLHGLGSVFGREFSHHQGTLAVGCHLYWIPSIRCTKAGAREPPRLNFTTNLMFFMISPIHSGDKTNGRLDTPPPISLTVYWLGGLAVNFGFKDLLAANIHLDLLGLGFGLLSKANLQDALVIVGAHLPRIYRTGERE